MAGLSKATIIGHLGGDPEMRYSPSGRAFTSFSVACGRNYTTGEGEKREETTWFRVTAWNKLAEICSQYLHKGSKVFIEGNLSSRMWEGQDGQKRFSLEVNASEMQILDSRAQGSASDSDGDPASPARDLDTIPF